METDKENVNCGKSRIPLPVDPLPALPKHLLNKNTEICNGTRNPLQTIGQTNVIAAGPSMSKKIGTKKKRILKLDTKHVTLRRNHDNQILDWELKVFTDCGDRDAIIISDDDSDERNTKEVKCFADKRQGNCLGDVRLAVTPSIKSPLENKGVKNVKRSLKRPHSRELQGLSPVGERKKKADDKVKRRLKFSEHLQDVLKAPDYWKKAYMTCLTRDYTDDMFVYLLNVERKPVDAPQTTSFARACIINWLMKVNGPSGNPAVVQTACWYFDSILGTSTVQAEKLQLVAAACLWIAQKLHGPAVPAMRLVKCSNIAFTAEKLLAAEKAVLQRLKFPLQPVNPQDFISYLAWWCDNDHPGDIEVAATFICMSGLMVDKVLCEEYPSVIAAAAVKNAVMLLGKSDLIVELQACPVYKAAAKKTPSLAFTSSILRRAVRTISDPIYEYKAPLDFYGVPPHYIAQTVIVAANELAVVDTRQC